MLLTAALLAVSGSAQEANSNATPGRGGWENLQALSQSQNVRIVLKDKKSYMGQFQSADAEAVVIRVGGVDQRLARPDVLRVSAKKAGHRGRNALIGLGIGAAAGVPLAVNCVRNSGGGGYDALCYPFAMGLTGAIGAGIGALIPTGGWQEVYRAP